MVGVYFSLVQAQLKNLEAAQAKNLATIFIVLLAIQRLIILLHSRIILKNLLIMDIGKTLKELSVSVLKE